MTPPVKAFADSEDDRSDNDQDESDDEVWQSRSHENTVLWLDDNKTKMQRKLTMFVFCNH